METLNESGEAHDEAGGDNYHNTEQAFRLKKDKKDQERKVQDNNKELNSKPNDENERELDLHGVDLIQKSSTDGVDSSLNSHHIVGGSWELIHHYPPTNVTTTLPNNTTKHSEYLADEIIDDVTQYDLDDVMQYTRAEKSRRKPRVSNVRPVRSVETDYEVREISQIGNPALEDTHDEDGRVVMINTRAIKRDGKLMML